MLKVETLNSVYADAEHYWKKGWVFTPKQDTCLQDLTAQCLVNADLAYSSRDNTGVDSPEAIVNTLNQDSLGTAPTLDGEPGDVIHDALVNECVDHLLGEARTWLNVVRNVVIPAVNNGFTAYEAEIRDFTVNNMWDLEVEQHHICPFYSSHAFVETVNRFKDTVFNEVGLYDLRLESTEERVVEMLRTGDPTIDQELLNVVPVGEILDVFHGVFGRQRRYSNTSDMARVPVQQRWIYPVVYQFASYLLNNIPEGVHLSLDDYRKYMTDLKIRMAKYCLAVLNQYQHEFDTRKMVIYQDAKKIVVDGRVFPAFIEQGGSEEVLQEAIRLGKWNWQWVFENLDAIKASRTKFINSQAAFQAQKIERAKLAVLEKHITDTARNMIPEEQMGVLDLLISELKQLNVSALDNPYHLFRDRLVELVFPGTPVLEILNHYDNVAPMIESGDAREIGTLAVIRWLVNRVMDTVEIERGRYDAVLSL